MKPKDYDYRSQFAKPMFKQGLNSVSSLKTGISLTGDRFTSIIVASIDATFLKDDSIFVLQEWSVMWPISAHSSTSAWVLAVLFTGVT